MSDLSESRKNILIVDDQLDNLRALSAILSRQNYRVRKANSGETALETIQAELPDLILLDICMPKMDGYAVCTALKAATETCKIPIIFLSALDDVVDKVKAFEVGGADYITKPFQAEEVLVRVSHQLTIQEQQRQINEHNRRLQQEIQERKQVEESLRLANEKLQRLANLDGLTQVANRHYFDEVFDVEWRRLRREQLPLSLILCDIDYFKFYNDTYGHLTGDDCLQQVTHAIAHTMKRPADLFARYGGEEFVMLLPNTDVKGAIYIAEQVQLEVANLAIPHAASSTSRYVTLSMGIASTIPTLEEEPKNLIAAADRALYAAKAKGRNTFDVAQLTAHSV